MDSVVEHGGFRWFALGVFGLMLALVFLYLCLIARSAWEGDWPYIDPNLANNAAAGMAIGVYMVWIMASRGNRLALPRKARNSMSLRIYLCAKFMLSVPLLVIALLISAFMLLDSVVEWVAFAWLGALDLPIRDGMPAYHRTTEVLFSLLIVLVVVRFLHGLVQEYTLVKPDTPMGGFEGRISGTGH